MAVSRVDLTTLVKPPKERMSLDEFLAWLDEDVWAEWEDGEVIVLSPASYQHQDIFGFLYALIRFFVELYDLGIVLAA